MAVRIDSGFLRLSAISRKGAPHSCVDSNWQCEVGGGRPYSRANRLTSGGVRRQACRDGRREYSRGNRRSGRGCVEHQSDSDESASRRIRRRPAAAPLELVGREPPGRPAPRTDCPRSRRPRAVLRGGRDADPARTRSRGSVARRTRRRTGERRERISSLSTEALPPPAADDHLSGGVAAGRRRGISPPRRPAEHGAARRARGQRVSRRDGGDRRGLVARPDRGVSARAPADRRGEAAGSTRRWQSGRPARNARTLERPGGRSAGPARRMRLASPPDRRPIGWSRTRRCRTRRARCRSGRTRASRSSSTDDAALGVDQVSSNPGGWPASNQTSSAASA